MVPLMHKSLHCRIPSFELLPAQSRSILWLLGVPFVHVHPLCRDYMNASVRCPCSPSLKTPNRVMKSSSTCLDAFNNCESRRDRVEYIKQFLRAFLANDASLHRGDRFCCVSLILETPSARLARTLCDAPVFCTSPDRTNHFFECEMKPDFSTLSSINMSVIWNRHTLPFTS